jgi:methyl-accepting chemotaxis protein
MFRTRLGLLVKIMVPLLVAGVLLIGAPIPLLGSFQGAVLQLAGLNTAKSMAQQIATMRRFYTQEVVSRAKKAGMGISYDFAQRDNTLPLPATMVRSFGEQVAREHPGTVVRLYSRYPFPFRKATERYDDFETQAIAFLERNPQQDFSRIEAINGRLSVRYAIADVMQPSCVACHNSHPLSPKRDWKVGDVRGVVEVVAPIEALSGGLSGAAAENGRRLMLTMSVITLVSLGALFLLIRRSVLKPIDELRAASETLAMGDTTATLTIRSSDELGDVANSLRRLIDYMRGVSSVAEAMSQGKLDQTVEPKGDRDQLSHSLSRMIGTWKGVIRRMRQVSEHLQSGTEQLSGLSGQLSRSSSEQAASTEETAAAIGQMSANLQSIDANARVLNDRTTTLNGQANEMGATISETSTAIAMLAGKIQQVAQRTTQAYEASAQASAVADDGDAIVRETLGGMRAIAEAMTSIRQSIDVLDRRSGEIGEIVEVIEDIADQTNLLALNAAIEAARAGEAGRGFAVVAEEVRKLAERSARATQEIGSLIKGIQGETRQAVAETHQGASRVEEGSALAARTGDAFGRIRAASSQVTDVIQEIAGATAEQARTGDQIVGAAERMSGIRGQVIDALRQVEEAVTSVGYATGEQRQGAQQIVVAVDQLSQLALGTSTVSEQVARAARELNQQAAKLQEAIGFFQVEEEAEGPPRVPATLQALPPVAMSGR